MLHIYQSESLKNLTGKFSEKITESKKGNPFSRPWVVVQNKEVRQWLSLELASGSQISANIEFVLPSELMWKLYRSFKPETPKVLPTDRLPLQWRIFELLQKSDEEELRKIKRFPLVSDRNQQFQLAGQIADVFDLYQVYRPEMLNAWKEGKVLTNDPDEFWQLWLWRKLSSHQKSGIPSRSEAFSELIDFLKNDNEMEGPLPEHLLVFGLSHFSTPFSELIKVLSERMEVHFFIQNWEATPDDIFSTHWNTISENWGTLKKESVETFSSYEKTFFNSGSSVFKKLSSNSKTKDFLQIHSCHNPRREIEVLKDEVLRLMDANKDLKPEDVCIMVPDMSEYAPLVKSIFSFNEGEPALPVYAPVSYTDEIKLTLIELFELISASPKAGTFIDFIELSYISKRFDFSEDDLSFIRTSIREQHIHHGLEVEDSAFSLEKLLLSLNSGYITEPASFELLNGVVPAEGLNGSDLFDLTTRLSSCVEILIEIRREIKDEKRPQEWLGQITGWLNKLSVESNSRLILTLERLMDVCIAADSNQKVGFDLMKKWLVSQLNDMDATSSGMGYGVVLSSYIPYRNVPFKMVALLGMNEGVFPRNPARPVFDLINNDPKPGERVTKKDDELLFLEILNSTQEYLYLSYLGQELHSENERLPSVLIQKLVDTLQISKEGLVYKKEKLHGFHSSYFEEATSYSSSRKELAELSRDPAENKSAFIKNDMNRLTALENQDLYLDDLISFFTHPCKYVSINTLGVNSGFEEHEAEDRELFNVSGLDRYLLEQRLFEILDMGISERKAEEYVLSRGLIPEGIPGKKVFDDKWEEINKYRETVISFRSGEKAKKEVSLNIEEMTLVGIVDDVYGNHLVHCRTGSERAKDLIKAWIQHLCLSSSDPEFEGTVLISKNKYGQIKSTHLGIIEHPLEGLKKLVDWFITAHTRKDHLCFFGESSKAFAEAGPDKDPLVEAYKNWEVIQFKPSEGGDFYNELIWRRQNPLEQPIFGELARQFWNPLLESIREER